MEKSIEEIQDELAMKYYCVKFSCLCSKRQRIIRNTARSLIAEKKGDTQALPDINSLIVERPKKKK